MSTKPHNWWCRWCSSEVHAHEDHGEVDCKNSQLARYAMEAEQQQELLKAIKDSPVGEMPVNQNKEISMKLTCRDCGVVVADEDEHVCPISGNRVRVVVLDKGWGIYPKAAGKVQVLLNPGLSDRDRAFLIQAVSHSVAGASNALAAEVTRIKESMK